MEQPEEDDFKVLQFHEMEIDDRVLKAIAKLGWAEPTLIQEKAIPLCLQGKDVLLRARTGSGKTGAFAIPAIQKVLAKKPESHNQVTRVLVLAPSKELCNQIQRNFAELTTKCSRDITCTDVSSQVDLNEQKPLLLEKPDVVVATPSRALLHLKANNMKLQDLEILIIDEADLVFSFGYENEVKEILSFLPKIYQAILASATLSEDVLSLKQLVLHNPVILKLKEPAIVPTSQLSHYHLRAEEEEKATILYVLLKLNLVRGKTIIFVNTVDKCYRIKLYLEQYAIPTCVLNSELPAAIRCHAVNQFNHGAYDIIVASDEKALEDPEKVPDKKGNRKKDKESGVIRGIDFQFVSNVINFDFPLTVDSYIHRVGRTARGKNEGTALSFVAMREQKLLKKEKKKNVEAHLRVGLNVSDDDDPVVQSYKFKLEEVEGFRYRARDAWRSVTKIAIREARLKEIRQEILNSDKLKSYFEDNPRDLQCLRHDKTLRTVRVQPHLAHVPDYIIPKSLKKLTNFSNKKKRFGHANTFTKAGSKAKYDKKQKDPLLSLKFDGFKKKNKKQKSK